MSYDTRRFARRSLRFSVGILGMGGLLLGLAGCATEKGAAPAAATPTSTSAKAEKGPAMLYIGSYGDPSGFAVANLDSKTGALTVGPTAAQLPKIAKPSFLAYSADRRFMYAANEHEPKGQLTALDISDPAAPKVLNTASTGSLPCHVSVHPSGRFLLTANYGDGTVTVNRIQADGRLGEATDLVRHTGAKREAHAHQILTDPSGQWVLAVDLGADSVYVYRLDTTTGKLAKHDQVVLPNGTGPRHLAFHPSAGYAYILGELLPSVTVATWDPAKGALKPGQVIETVSPGAKGPNYPGEIAVSSDGGFIYASNRGENSIATFAVQDKGARLEFLGTAPTGGNWPRHFTLSPDEQWMYVSNQRSNQVTWLPRDVQTGRLGAPAGSLPVPTVAIVLFR